MQQVKISTVVAILVAGVLLGTGIDAMLNVGDTFKGNITFMDTDVVEFEGLAGEKVTISVKASKGQGLIPLVTLRAPDMSVVAQDFTGKKKASIKKQELPMTGIYQIEVSGQNGTIGSYKMTTGSKLGKAITKRKNDASVGNGEIQDTEFEAKSAVPDRKDPKGPLKTWTMSGTIKSKKNSDAVPFNPVICILDPDGGEPTQLTPIEDYISKNKKGEFKFKNLPLPDLGAYVLKVENSGMSGIITTNLTIKKPKLKKQVISKEL